MAQVTYLGDGSEADMLIGDLTFKKGETKEVKDLALAERLADSKFWKVTGLDEPVADDTVKVPVPAPSETPVGGPVPKPGEATRIPKATPKF